MKHVIVMHLLQALEDLVQAVPAELFRVLAVILRHNFRHRSQLHVLEHDIDDFAVKVQVEATHQFIAI